MRFKISIILPVYNVEKYIVDALESIIRQTIGLEHLEVIMVNDCSTDNSGEIIEEYAAKYDNFKAINLLENSGAAGKPRNVGIEHAQGEYLMFLDPDDYYSEDACEILYKKIVEEDGDITFGRYVFLYDTPAISENFFGEHDEIKISCIEENPKILEIPPSLWTKIYKKSFIVDNTIKFPEFIPGQDLVFVSEAFLKAKKITFLNDSIILYYRVRCDEDTSITYKRMKKEMLGLLKAYKLTYAIYEVLNYEKYFSIVIENHLPYWTRHFILSDLNSDERIQILKESEILFDKYKEYDLVPDEKFLADLFELFNNRKYEESLLVIKALKDFLIEKDRLEGYITSLKNSYEDQLNKSKQKLHLKEQELKVSKEKLEEQAQFIEDLLSSNSWRLTKPLRAISNNFKKH